MACPRLSRAREAERQRAIQRPLSVAWREKCAENGQIYISISSDSGSDSEDDELTPPTQSEEAASGGFALGRGRGLAVSTEFQASRSPQAVKREHSPEPRQPVVYTIDSDSDEEAEQPQLQ
ncbi:hypothetical protein BBJ28_00020454, partial [Nothophytophthora sp. Chile5]